MKYRVWIEYRGKGYATVEADSKEEAITKATDECCEGAMEDLHQYDARADEIDEFCPTANVGKPEISST